MLVLRRFVGEEVLIGAENEISIKILSNKDGVVRLGIHAPSNIPIQRKERRCISKIITIHMDLLSSEGVSHDAT